MRHWHHLLWLSTCLWFTGGCVGGSQQASTPVVIFPTKDKLRSYAQAPKTRVFPKRDTAPAQAWELSEDLVSLAGTSPRPTIGGWDKLLESEVSSKALLSEQMHCATREVARFVLATGGLPGQRLQRFIAGRCGVVAPNPTFFGGRIELPESVPEDELLKSVRENFPEALSGLTEKYATEVGIHFARDEKYGVIAYGFGRTPARLDPVQAGTLAQGRIELQGTTDKQADLVLAMVNMGDSKVAPCVTDPKVALPKFRLECPLDKNDEKTWVDVLAHEPERVLMEGIANVMVHRGDEASRRFAYTPSADAFTNDEQLSQLLLQKVGTLRKKHGLPPVQEPRPQSAIVSLIAPRLMGAMYGGEDEAVDEMSLGLIAGWDVPGVVRKGDLFVSGVYGAQSPQDWLDTVLDSPLGRSVLLDEDIKYLTIGATAEEQAIGAVAASYALFEKPADPAYVKQAQETIKRYRQAQKLPEPTFIESDTLNDAALRINREGLAPMDALQQAIFQMNYDPEIGAYTVETADLRFLDFPESYARPGPLTLALAVTYHKPKGAAWGQYVVLAVGVTR